MVLGSCGCDMKVIITQVVGDHMRIHPNQSKTAQVTYKKPY